MLSFAALMARLGAGMRMLRKDTPKALAHKLLGEGLIVFYIVSFVLLGPFGPFAVLVVAVLRAAWRSGGDAEVVPAPAPVEPAEPAAASQAESSPPFATAQFTSGVAAMPRALKTVLLLVAAAVVLWIFAPFAIVPAGSRGVVTTFGKISPEVLDEGIHFRIPIAQTVHLIDVRIQKGEGSGDAASKDLQQVHTTVALNYHIDPKQAAHVFRELGQSIGDRIIVPAVQEAVKAATAQYTAEELIAKRPEIRERIRALLVERMSRHGVVVDEFSIVNFTFSKSFNEAIEAKTTAEQLKLKAERDLQRIRVEAEQKVTQAKAEAEALSLQKQQVTAELIRLREIENQRKAIEKWDGKLPQVSGGATPFINVTPSR